MHQASFKKHYIFISSFTNLQDITFVLTVYLRETHKPPVRAVSRLHVNVLEQSVMGVVLLFQKVFVPS